MRANFINVIINGVSEKYFENGNLETIGNFINGKIDGIEEHYYENGRLRHKADHKDGIQNGVLNNIMKVVN